MRFNALSLNESSSGSSKKQGSKFKTFVSLLIIGIAVAMLLPAKRALLISEYKSGKPLYAIPIEIDEELKISYTHSANRSPVVDTFVYTGEEFKVISSEFKTFGAGIPIPSDGAGELITTDDGYMLVNINKTDKELILMTQSIPDHRLIYRGKQISLNKLCGAGKAIKLETCDVPIAYLVFDYIQKGKLHESI